MSHKAYLKHKTSDTINLLMRRWHFCVTFDITTMMAGKNQAALAVCAQTKVIFPFKLVMVLAWFPITASWNTACYIRGLIHGIGRGVPNELRERTIPKCTERRTIMQILYITILYITFSRKWIPLPFNLPNIHRYKKKTFKTLLV